MEGGRAGALEEDSFLEDAREGFEKFSEGMKNEDTDAGVPPPPAPHSVARPMSPTRKQRRLSNGSAPSPETPISPISPETPTTPGSTPGLQLNLKLCLACSCVASKGSLCAKHKRVSDNLYTEERRNKDKDPEKFKKFMQMRKEQGQEWIRVLVEAEATKGGNLGSGRATGSFNCMVEKQTMSQTSGIAAKFFNKQMNCRMFMNKIMEEWGWDTKDAAEEWKRKVAATPPDQIVQKPTAPGRKMEDWILVHDFDAVEGSQGLSHRHDVELQEKAKKNPKESDIAEAEAALSSTSLRFSDRLFGQMPATSAALNAVRDSGSAFVDSAGRSLIFAENSSLRAKSAAASGSGKGDAQEKNKNKGKSKPFVLEDMLDAIDFRLKKRRDHCQKSCEDLAKEIQDFFSKEPQEKLDKMARIVNQVRSRAVLLRGLLADVTAEPESLSLTFSKTDLGMEEAQVDGLTSEISEDDKVQFRAAQFLRSELAKFKAEPDAAAATKSLSELVADLCEREFCVSAEEITQYLEKDALHNLFRLHGWAGSGFEGDVDLTKLGQDLDEYLKVVYVHIVFKCTLGYFLTVAKPVIEPDLMNQILPLRVSSFRYQLEFRLQTDEDGVKALEQSHKDEMDLNKSLINGIRSSFSTLTRQSRELLREQVRLQSQADKERLAAEKAKEKEEKAKLRNIQDQMKGADKLPGLLAFCGSWVQPLKVFKLADYQSAKGTWDFTKPLIIEDVPSLREEDGSASARVNFSLFKAGSRALPREKKFARERSFWFCRKGLLLVILLAEIMIDCGHILSRVGLVLCFCPAVLMVFLGMHLVRRNSRNQQGLKRTGTRTAGPLPLR